MKKPRIRKCLRHKRLHAVTLAGSLLLLSVLPYLSARVHAKSTYTMQQVVEDNISLKNEDTVLISGREDLELLDQYLESGAPVSKDTTFYQTCDIALSDYTFSTVQDNDKSLIKIYHSSTEKCEAVFDASSNKFYTDDSCQTESDFRSDQLHIRIWDTTRAINTLSPGFGITLCSPPSQKELSDFLTI